MKAVTIHFTFKCCSVSAIRRAKLLYSHSGLCCKICFLNCFVVPLRFWWLCFFHVKCFSCASLVDDALFRCLLVSVACFSVIDSSCKVALLHIVVRVAKFVFLICICRTFEVLVVVILPCHVFFLCLFS